MVIIFIPIVINVFPRILVIALLFCSYKGLLGFGFGWLVLSTLLFLLACAAWDEWKTIPFKKVYLGLLASLLAPCIILDDYSYFFIRTGCLSATFYLLTTWMIYFVKIDNHFFQILNTHLSLENKESIFECTHYFENNTSTKHCCMEEYEWNCFDGFWSIPGSNCTTVCPVDYEKWTHLYNFTWILTSLLIISMLCMFFMQYFKDPLRKMKFYQNISNKKLIVWRKSDKLWLSHLNKLLDNKYYDWIELQKLNEEVIEEFGKSLLELSVDSRYHILTKVNNYS